MAKTPDTGDAQQSAWLWPAEWATERAFWREVGTRTISGVLTIVLIGVPTLIWAGLSGALRWETVAPIVVGVVFFAIVIGLYAGVVVTIRRRERSNIEAALAVETFVSGIVPDPALLSTLSPEQRKAVMDSLSESGRARIAAAMRSARSQSRLAAIAGIVTVVLSAVGMAFLEPLVRIWTGVN